MSAADASSCREVPVTFMGPEGFQLAGVLCEPAAEHADGGGETRPCQPHQCAMLCHGFASHKNGFLFPAIAHRLATQLGMSSLRFDYTGNMDSPGPFRFASFDKEVQQMAAAKHFLEQHGKQVVLLLGHSRGAINATLYSGQQQQQDAAPSGDGDGSHIIPLVVLVAGRYDLRLNMYQRYGQDVLQQLQQSGPWQQVSKRDGDRHPITWTLTAEDLQQRFDYDIPAACAAISSIQPPEAQPEVLVVRGSADDICEASDTAALAQHIAGAHLLEVPGASHFFTEQGAEETLLQAVEDFVRCWDPSVSQRAVQ